MEIILTILFTYGSFAFGTLYETKASVFTNGAAVAFGAVAHHHGNISVQKLHIVKTAEIWA